MGIYNIPPQQSLSYRSAIAPLLNSQKAMEKYFCPILSAHALQRLNSKESRKENTTNFRGLPWLQKSSLLPGKHHGAPATTASLRAISAEVPTQRCTLFLSVSIAARTRRNRYGFNRNRYGFKLGILASKVQNPFVAWAPGSQVNSLERPWRVKNRS